MCAFAKMHGRAVTGNPRALTQTLMSLDSKGRENRRIWYMGVWGYVSSDLSPHAFAGCYQNECAGAH